MWRCQFCETFNNQEHCVVCGKAKATSEDILNRKRSMETPKPPVTPPPKTSTPSPAEPDVAQKLPASFWALFFMILVTLFIVIIVLISSY